MKHVQHVRGKWVARVTVPDELRTILGKRELVEELPGDAKGRERLAHAVLSRFHATLDDARAVLAANRPTLSTAAKAHYRTELEADDKGRAVRAITDDTGLNLPRSIYATKLRLLAAGAITGEEADALMGYAINDLRRRGLVPDVPRPDLLRALAEVQLDAIARFEERDAGIVRQAPPASPLLTAPDPEPLTMAPGQRGTGTTLLDILSAFHKERGAGGRSLADKTMDEHKTAIRMFGEFAGANMPVKSITKKDLIAYKQALLETPTRYTLRFPGLTLPQAIKANQKRETPFETLDPGTINMKWLSHLSSILKWAANNGFIETNPAQGVRVDVGSATHMEPSRLPFDRPEIQKIFGHEMFADPAKYETRQWAVLLALYTGARSSSEISRIKLTDIYQEQNVWVVNLSGASVRRRMNWNSRFDFGADGLGSSGSCYAAWR